MVNMEIFESMSGFYETKKYIVVKPEFWSNYSGFYVINPIIIYIVE